MSATSDVNKPSKQEDLDSSNGGNRQVSSGDSTSSMTLQAPETNTGRSVEFREAQNDSNDSDDSNEPKDMNAAGQDDDDSYMDVETRKRHFKEKRTFRKALESGETTTN